MTTEPRIYHEPGAARPDADQVFQAQLREGSARLLTAGQPLEAGLLSLAAWRIGVLSSDLAFFRRPLPSNADSPDDEADGERNPAFPHVRAKRPPAAGPRHKFVNGACVSIHGTDGKVCGKAKGRPGRPPAPVALEPSEAPPGVVPPGYRAPLNMTAAADRHVDGGLGSSGVRR